jgi:hypothetical protein
VALALMLGAPPSATGGEGSDIERMIAEAKTSADHGAIAAYYEKEARFAREREERHRRMAKTYGRFPVLKKKTSVVKHCESIARWYRNLAQEYEGLTRSHREMAAAGP